MICYHLHPIPVNPDDPIPVNPDDYQRRWVQCRCNAGVAFGKRRRVGNYLNRFTMAETN